MTGIFPEYLIFGRPEYPERFLYLDMSYADTKNVFEKQKAESRKKKAESRKQKAESISRKQKA